MLKIYGAFSVFILTLAFPVIGIVTVPLLVIWAFRAVRGIRYARALTRMLDHQQQTKAEYASARTITGFWR